MYMYVFHIYIYSVPPWLMYLSDKNIKQTMMNQTNRPHNDLWPQIRVRHASLAELRTGESNAPAQASDMLRTALPPCIMCDGIIIIIIIIIII